MFIGIKSAVFYVSDINKAKDFYTNILNFKIVEDQGHYVTLQIGTDNNINLALNSQHRSFQIAGKQTISVTCTNIDNLYQVLTKKGVKIFDKLTTQPWGRYFAIEDIDGNHIDITEI